MARESVEALGMMTSPVSGLTMPRPLAARRSRAALMDVIRLPVWRSLKWDSPPTASASSRSTQVSPLSARVLRPLLQPVCFLRRAYTLFLLFPSVAAARSMMRPRSPPTAGAAASSFAVSCRKSCCAGVRAIAAPPFIPCCRSCPSRRPAAAQGMPANRRRSPRREGPRPRNWPAR